jgi:uncharacterized membrane protein
VRLGPRAAKRLREVTGAIWFLPVLISAVCIALALALPWAEAHVGALARAGRSPSLQLFQSSPDGARTVLTSAAGALATIVGVAFSLTLVTLQLAAGQYGPRVIASYVRDGTTRVALGLFVGTIAYLLLVVLSIRSAGAARGEFVPPVALALAILLILACLITLAYFLHHLSRSIQAETVIAGIGRDVIREIHRIAREDAGGDPTSAPDAGSGTAVTALTAGYLQVVDLERLAAAVPCDRPRTAVVVAAAGDFVLPDAPLVRLDPPLDLSPGVERRLRSAFALGRSRTHREDVLFGIRQLVDTALRALSPGLNDVTTAVEVVNELGAVALEYARSSAGSERTHRRVRFGDVTVVVPRASLGDVLEHAFSEIPRAGIGHPRLLVRVLDVLERLGEVVRVPAERRALRRVSAVVGQSVAAATALEWEREVLRARWIAVRRALEAGPVPGAEPPPLDRP